MATTPPKETLAAWLETIVAEKGEQEGAPTVLPVSDPHQPFLTSFQAHSGKGSAAPIDVGDTIAEGGMGVIRIAEQEALGRNVVVKTLRSDVAMEAAEHVLREAWATGALEHPNIVPVHDIRTNEDGSPMIVLKRIEGSTWSTLMHDPALVEERFGVTNHLHWNTDILRQVTQAVRFAHSRGILHRDLKPDNVMIGAFGEVYLVDWGIAMRLQNAETTRLPPADGENEMAGTPCYMAPEMLGGKSLDERTDTYLLGAMLYEILAGKPPHSLDSLDQLMDDIRESRPVLPEGVCPLLSALCLRAMSKRPEDRYQDASAFAQALADNREHRESAAMAELANKQVKELEAQLQKEEPGRHEVYNLLGALRLGFGEALKIWPENREAKTALDRALTSVIEFELEQHNPEAAQLLLKELDDDSPSLSERVEKALAKKRSEKEELAQFRKDSDHSVGQGTRLAVMLFLGVIWTAAPLLRYINITEKNVMSYYDLALGTAVFMAINIVVYILVRNMRLRTKFNLRLSRALFSVFPLQIVLMLGVAPLGLPSSYSAGLMLFLWLTVSSIVCITVDARLWPVPIAYLVAFFVTTSYLEWRFFAIAGANFVLMCTAIYVWYRKPEPKQSQPAAS